MAAAEEAPLLALAEFAVSLVEKMQAQEILRSLRLPEFDDLSQFFRNLPTTALVGIGAFAAVVAYWFASRPKAVKPPCDLRMQSEEVKVRLGWHGGGLDFTWGLQGGDVQAAFLCSVGDGAPARYPEECRGLLLGVSSIQLDTCWGSGAGPEVPPPGTTAGAGRCFYSF